MEKTLPRSVPSEHWNASVSVDEGKNAHISQPAFKGQEVNIQQNMKTGVVPDHAIALKIWERSLLKKTVAFQLTLHAEQG